MKRVKYILIGSGLLTGWATAFAQPEIEEVDFEKHVKPILESSCLNCHNEQEAEGDLRLDTRIQAYRGGSEGPSIIRGNPENSTLYQRTIVPEDDIDIMPPEGPPLSERQTEILRKWIEAGAQWPVEDPLQPTPRVLFTEHVQPILEESCVSCHREENAEGDLRLDTNSEAFTELESGWSILPFDPDSSRVYVSTDLPPDHPDLMPPGQPLSDSNKEILRSWIEQGAVWPDGIELSPRLKMDEPEEIAEGEDEEEGETYRDHLRERFAARQGQTMQGIKMEPYVEEIPGSSVTFEMVPVPAGNFLMGSPPDEPGREPDEGPQHEVEVDAFWMAKHEVTWEEFELFMYPDEVSRAGDPYVGELVDAVARPTAPYVEMSFGMGKDGYPAISMTQYAARKYCEWLSAKTGTFYRLPTEAEWEYACRAGTTTAYSFGDDPAKLDEYAWYQGNSGSKYQKVGEKKPNPWGLHDMHGNVAEWVLDQYDPDYYEQFDGLVRNPYNRPTEEYPRVVRGGSWQDEPEALRSAARRGSNPAWKALDPQLPKSRWYHTSAQFLGFRVVRPLNIPPAHDFAKYWTENIESR